eukprot:g68105.t1
MPLSLRERVDPAVPLWQEVAKIWRKWRFPPPERGSNPQGLLSDSDSNCVSFRFSLRAALIMPVQLLICSINTSHVLQPRCHRSPNRPLLAAAYLKLESDDDI